MTDAEKAALEWLEIIHGPEGTKAAEHKRILLKLLAEPRLPAEPEVRMLIAMDNAIPGPTQYDNLRLAYRALYAHLTAPKTKTVEVWRVEWALNNYPMLHQHLSEVDARANAKLIAQENHRTCIRVTGPHKQEVPA